MKKENIKEFFNFDNIAVIGVSRNAKKFGNYIFNELKKNGKKVFPVNPFLKEFGEEKCYNSVEELPDNIQRIVFVTKPEITNQLLPKVLEKGIANIWFQQGSSDKLSIEFCITNNLKFIHAECLLMYLEPVKSFHKFHKFIWKLFGKYAA